jgi:hypothetical protein
MGTQRSTETVPSTAALARGILLLVIAVLTAGAVMRRSVDLV